MKTLGVILAGGHSRRMGQDKADLAWGDQTLLSHTALRLSHQISPVIVNANTRPIGWDGPVIPDPYEAQMGPLLGVLAGMNYADQAGYDAILTVPVDAPFFPLDLSNKLIKDDQAAIRLACVEHADQRKRLQPTFGCWHVSLTEALDKFLRDGGRKVTDFVDQHVSEKAIWPQKDAKMFFNINTPEDLKTAHEMQGINP